MLNTAIKTEIYEKYMILVDTHYLLIFQLLESVQGVSDAVSDTPPEEPPLPPYPNISDLSITGRSKHFNCHSFLVNLYIIHKSYHAKNKVFTWRIVLHNLKACCKG